MILLLFPMTKLLKAKMCHHESKAQKGQQNQSLFIYRMSLIAWEASR